MFMCAAEAVAALVTKEDLEARFNSLNSPELT